MTTRKHPHLIGKREMRSLPKIMLHEHLDCSLRPLTMLELWDELGFHNARIAFPEKVLRIWRKGLKAHGVERRRLRAAAASSYQDFLVTFASSSLANYVQAIVDHVLPLMQTKKNLRRITRERIEDARRDGIVAMELRFAPQLHTAGGLSLEEVMDAVIAGSSNSPFPLKLCVCALRHEDRAMASRLADLAIKYRKWVGVFDLAADEEANPGVLAWWLPEAERVRDETDGETLLTCHLTETRKATRRDHQLVRDHNIGRLGHGIQDDWYDEVLEVCPTSNVVTGQVSSFAQHPIDRFLKEGRHVTVNTDGTLFTRVQLTDEYLKLQETFGWSLPELLTVNLTALEASCFSAKVKSKLKKVIKAAYRA